MSKELFSSIDIAAPAERVWEVLVDFAAFPVWNPFITQAEGRLEVPEVDRVGWLDLDTAAVKLVKGQVPFLARLREALVASG